MAQDAGALGAAGEDADELDGVDGLRVAAVAGHAAAASREITAARDATASREIAAGQAAQRERVRLAVAPGPLGRDVRDDPAVVPGRELGRDAGGPGDAIRCTQASRVKPMSNR